MYGMNKLVRVESKNNNFEAHVMYDKETGEEYFVETEDDHNKLSALGMVHSPPLINISIRKQIVKSMVQLDPAKRRQEIAGMKIEEDLSEPNIVVYTTSAPEQDTLLFIAYFCPNKSYFDNVNDEVCLGLMQTGIRVNTILKDRGYVEEAKKIYHLGVGSEIATEVAKKMAQIF